jgi:beta-lactam-binding protein with PASTA domain
VFSVKASSKASEPGVVVSQVPAKGAQAEYGQAIQLTMSAPSNVGKEKVFGLFRFSLPPQAVAVNIRLVNASDAMPKEIISMKHPGGPLAVPYIVPDGTDIVLYVLDQEVSREKASAIQF